MRVRPARRVLHRNDKTRRRNRSQDQPLHHTSQHALGNTTLYTRVCLGIHGTVPTKLDQNYRTRHATPADEIPRHVSLPLSATRPINRGAARTGRTPDLLRHALRHASQGLFCRAATRSSTAGGVSWCNPAFAGGVFVRSGFHRDLPEAGVSITTGQTAAGEELDCVAVWPARASGVAGGATSSSCGDGAHHTAAWTATSSDSAPRR